MNPSLLQPPTLRADLPVYPILTQTLRVTAATVPGPAGVAQFAGSSVLGPTLYVAFTQQQRTDSLLLRDREPCLADDVNGVIQGNPGFPGFYDGRLSGSHNSLPVYTIIARAATSSGGGGSPSELIDISGRAGVVANVTAVQFLRAVASGTAGAAVVTPDDVSGTLPGDVNLVADQIMGLGMKLFNDGITVGGVGAAFKTRIDNVGNIDLGAGFVDVYLQHGINDQRYWRIQTETGTVAFTDYVRFTVNLNCLYDSFGTFKVYSEITEGPVGGFQQKRFVVGADTDGAIDTVQPQYSVFEIDGLGSGTIRDGGTATGAAGDVFVGGLFISAGAAGITGTFGG